jgi:Family of unknown function (DUF5343)
MSTVGAEKWTPPYVSWATLNNTIERMVKEQSYPEQVDRSYLSNLPGGAQSELITAMKSLGLTDENTRPTVVLKQLVNQPDVRPAIFREILDEHFQGPLSLSKHATQLQLEEEFRKYGVQGSTLRKAVRFFLAAAKYAEIELSKNFRPPRAERTARKPRSPGNAETPHQPVEPPHAPHRNLHPFIQGLFEELPDAGEVFPPDKQETWLEMARMTFKMLYRIDASPVVTPVVTNQFIPMEPDEGDD